MPSASWSPAASASSQKLVLLRDGAVELHCDLSALGGDHLNDMVVDGSGDAYVDLIFHAPTFSGPRVRQDDRFDMLVLVRPDGSFRIAATGSRAPTASRSIRTAGGWSWRRRGQPAHQRSDRSRDRGTIDRKVFLEMGELVPDGIGVAPGGAVWTSAAFTCEALHVTPDGQIDRRIRCDGELLLDCQLGATENDLYLATNGATRGMLGEGKGDGRIEYVNFAA